MTEGWSGRLRIADDVRALLERPVELVRPFFRARRDRFDALRDGLRLAGMAVPVDRYLAVAVRDGLVAGGVGTLLTLVGLSVAMAFRIVAPGGSIRSAALVMAAAVGVGVVAFAGVVGWRAVEPALRARDRSREINGFLPFGMVTMYSLARGGMGFRDVTDVLASSRETFGAFAAEFARIRRDVAYLGSNELDALSAAAARTPSERLGTVLEDLSSVVESGTSLEDFLAMESNRQLDRLRRDQEDLLQTLEVFAQSYFVVVFVAPLFALVLLVLLSFVGADTLPVVELLIYVDLPVATLGSVVLARRIHGNRTPPGRLPVSPISTADRPAEPPPGEVVRRYRRARRRRSLRRRLSRPLTEARRRPWLSLVVSVPLAAGVGLLLARTAGIGLGPDGYAEAPVLATAVLAVAAVVAAAPLSALHEAKRRHERTLVGEFPPALEVIGEANEVGIDLVESFDVVAARLEGPVAEELRTVHDDVQLTGDVEAALADLTERVRVPEFRLATAVLRAGYWATGDLAAVLETLAEAMDRRHALSRDRRRAMGLYVFILFLGVGTFLVIAYFLNAFFFPPLVEVGSQLGGLEGEARFLEPTDVPVERYRTLLFHAALVQSAGNGLLMGTLVDDRPLSGLKYVLVLVALSVAVFLIL